MIGSVLSLDVLAHHDVGAEIHCQSDHQTHSHLTYNLELASQAVLVVLGEFLVVVEEAEQSEEQC